MKTEHGITLIVLITTVVLMITLAAVAINAGYDSIESTKLQAFNYELQQVQCKVDAIHEKIKNGDMSYIILGSNITENSRALATLKAVTGMDYNNIPSNERENYYYNETYTTYRYVSQRTLMDYLDISSDAGDMIINFITREVISVDGFTYKGTTYYRLGDFSGSYVSIGNTTTNEILQTANNNSSQVHSTNSYISDGLILHYDAINNTGNGHSNTATVWKDLSGNGNYGTINGVTWKSDSLLFDGIDDWVSIDEINPENITVEVVMEYITHKTNQEK